MLGRIFKTLIEIHVQMIQVHPEFGSINNLHLLTQKLRFRLVEATKPLQQQQIEQQQQQIEQQQQQQQLEKQNLVFEEMFHLIVSSVNDFYGVEMQHPDFLKNIFLQFQKNILMIE